MTMLLESDFHLMLIIFVFLYLNHLLFHLDYKKLCYFAETILLVQEKLLLKIFIVEVIKFIIIVTKIIVLTLFLYYWFVQGFAAFS